MLKKLLVAVKDAYLEQRAMTEAENVDDQQDPNAPKPEPSNVITEEDLIEIQLLDDFLVKHRRSFENKKEVWNKFI